MYLQQYSKQNCDGDVVSVSGVPVGVCLPEYDSNNKAVGAILFSCNSGTHTVFVTVQSMVSNPLLSTARLLFRSLS